MTRIRSPAAVNRPTRARYSIGRFYVGRPAANTTSVPPPPHTHTQRDVDIDPDIVLTALLLQGESVTHFDSK